MKKNLVVAVLFCTALAMGSAIYAQPIGSKTFGDAIAAGTLADANNPVEMALAPEYTRLYMVRQRMTRLLKRLSVSEQDPDVLKRAILSATSVQQHADDARAKLDQASKLHALDVGFNALLTGARDALARAERAYSVAKGE